VEIIKIKETLKTPSVYFDADKGLIEMTGRVIPEDTKKFFLPLINWVKLYSKTPSQKTIVNLKLEYFSTSASKLILELLKELEIIHQEKHKIAVNWYYEFDDDSMAEVLDIFKSMIDLPFEGKETTFPSKLL
jgi:hypothetical protein